MKSIVEKQYLWKKRCRELTKPEDGAGTRRRSGRHDVGPYAYSSHLE